MEHYFDLPVLYQGQELILKGRLVTFAYSYKFYIIVNGRELIFEKDEEQQIRVCSEGAQSTFIEEGMLHAITATLQNI